VRDTHLNPAKLQAIQDAINGVPALPGDLAELGVYRGGVGRMMATCCPGRTVHLFDTFTGIPWDGYDESIDGHRPGDFAGSLDSVKEHLRDCSNVVYHPGLFPGTTTGVDARFAVVHLDADLYASTIAGLRWFWPRVNVGGSIILDDWQWDRCRGVTKAVGEFFGDEHPDAAFAVRAENQLTVTKVR
jgi:hypothetical protein